MKEYLGDSVYIDDWENGFKLTTENGLPSDPSMVIYLEPEVAIALAKHITKALGMEEPE